MNSQDSSEKFISKFCQWADTGGLPKSGRRRLPGLLRRIIREDLPQRESEAWVIIRDFANSDGLRCKLLAQDTMLFPDPGKSLICATMMPEWRDGWRQVVNDEILDHCLRWFFHLSSQYVARSRAANAQGAIALVYQRSCSFSHGGTIYRTKRVQLDSQDIIRSTYGELHPLGPAIPIDDAPSSLKERELRIWFDILNALDPFVHRAIFQYIRALQLEQADFNEQAITALDGIVSVAAQFVRQRLNVIEDDGREALFDILNISTSDQEVLRRINTLRRHFGAHPGQNAWWDFGEIFGDEIDSFRHVAKKLIFKLATCERDHRTVNKQPVSWSEWFSDNCNLLWESVWTLPA